MGPFLSFWPYEESITYVLSTRSVGAVAKQSSPMKNWNGMERKCQKRACQVIENMVELVGLEPTTSSLRTMASANLSLLSA